MHRRSARALTAALLLASGSTALAAQRSYSVTDFDRIQVDGPYTVTLATGRGSSARASGSADALDRLSVEVEGRTLRLRRNQSAWGGYPGQQQGGPISITVTTQDLSAATVNGSGALDIDKAKGLRLDLAVAGSGRISTHAIAVDNLIVGLLGSGSISLAGTAKTVRIEAHGAAEVDGTNFTAADAVVIGDTAGPIRLAATRTANVTALSAGPIEVSGKAACQVKSSGTGEILCGSRAPVR